VNVGEGASVGEQVSVSEGDMSVGEQVSVGERNVSIGKGDSNGKQFKNLVL